MKTITGQTGAWLSEFCQNKEVGDVNDVSFAKTDMSKYGWIKIGTAEITVKINDENEILQSRIDVLKTAEKNLMAETEVKLNVIREKIQSLLAIEFQPCL